MDGNGSLVSGIITGEGVGEKEGMGIVFSDETGKAVRD